MPVSIASLTNSVVSQFHHPHGWLGQLAGWVMAYRPSNRARNLWTLDLLELGPEDRVLEVGFGPGVALREKARRVPSGLVVGVDHSEAMLTQASRRNSKAILAGHVRLLLGRVEELPQEIGDFDKIYAVNVVQFWRDAPEMIARLGKRLRRGGGIAITYQPRAGLEGVRTARLEIRPVPAVCVLGTCLGPSASESGG